MDSSSGEHECPSTNILSLCVVSRHTTRVNRQLTGGVCEVKSAHLEAASEANMHNDITTGSNVDTFMRPNMQTPASVRICFKGTFHLSSCMNTSTLTLEFILLNVSVKVFKLVVHGGHPSHHASPVLPVSVYWSHCCFLLSLFLHANRPRDAQIGSREYT